MRGKKYFVIGATVIIILATITIQAEENTGKKFNKSETKKTVTFVIDVTPNPVNTEVNHSYQQTSINKNEAYQYEIKQTEEDAEDLLNKIKDIKNDIELINLLREEGILDKSFTMKNLTKTSLILKEGIKEYCKEKNSEKLKHQVKETKNEFNNYTNLDNVEWIWKEPLISFGSAGVIISLGAQILALPIGLIEHEIDYFEKEIPLFADSEYHPAWNFTSIVALCYLDLLFGHSVLTFGRIMSIFPPDNIFWVGPFYALLGLTAGFSVTVYYTGPPTEVVADFIIYGSAVTTVLPFNFGE
jgi:hypothetical protein